MKKILIALTIMMIGSFANADLKKCGYAPRSVMGEALSNLDASIVGLADCHDLLPDTSSLVVGKFESLDESKLREFVMKHSRLADGTSKSASLTWQSRQPIEKRQLIVKTLSPVNPSRDHEDVMSHYAFVAKGTNGSFYVFVHTSMDADAKKVRPSLEKLNRSLSQAAFLARI
ncbi:MAG: hypothetical protein EOP09_20715 [Proteobacteria bacterium]|nr:MAG: hypothetical protein EOP09_20715 [Pseudomonadota bacterium]